MVGKIIEHSMADSDIQVGGQIMWRIQKFGQSKGFNMFPMALGKNVSRKMSLDKQSPDTKTVGLHFGGWMKSNASLKWQLDTYNES